MIKGTLFTWQSSEEDYFISFNSYSLWRHFPFLKAKLHVSLFTNKQNDNCLGCQILFDISLGTTCS